MRVLIRSSDLEVVSPFDYVEKTLTGKNVLSKRTYSFLYERRNSIAEEIKLVRL